MGVPFIAITLNSKVIERKMLDKEEAIIGRIQENDIIIDNLAVSRRHAKIYIKDGKVVIKDLGSANGTFVNGVQVDEAELKSGDIILIGKHMLKFYEEESQRSEESLAFRYGEGTVMVDAKTQEKFLEKLKGELSSSKATKPVIAESSTVPKTGRLSSFKAPKLILFDGREIEINNDFFKIGKNFNSNLKIDGLFVKSPHANIIKRTDGTYRIVSMGSFLRPTKVNGSKVKEQILRDGDIIRIGRHEMMFAL
jgi:pSer/pThr/pTyr-binding forkhead associated (FHA) protein